MSSISLAKGRPVLIDRLVSRSLSTDLVLIVAGAGLTALAAQIYIPMWPVPITGQTLAVLLVGGSLGATRGALSMVLYALVGTLGLPVFSEASHGVGVTFGASGGYIVGFILGAAVTGWLAQRKWDRKFLGGFVAYLAGSVAVFVVALPWLGFVLNLSPAETLAAGLYPFIVGGIIKSAIAAAVIRGGWFLVANRERHQD